MFSGMFSPTHLLIVIAVVVFLFGRNAAAGWLSMIGGGVKDFYKGLREINGVKDTATKELTDCRDQATTQANEIKGNISRLG